MSKGQVTVPKAVRHALAIRAGDEVVFRVEGHRAVLAPIPRFLDLAGTIRVPAAKRNVAWGEVIARTRSASGGTSTVGVVVDTNILVRHLTADPPHMAARATAYLESATDLLLTDVIAEMVYVLEFALRGPAPAGGRGPARPGHVRVSGIRRSGLLLRAAEVYEVDHVDFAEAYLVACAESTGVGAIASFDRTLDRLRSIDRVEPPAP